MNSAELARYWESNARAWTLLARQGYDVYRDHINTPAFLSFLPDVAGMHGLDIGCGEGHNTRQLADRGALVTAIDISSAFVDYARGHSDHDPERTRYLVADATRLPFRSDHFAFATAFMSLMDVGSPERGLREAYRVLKTGGFLQFSILHPCFTTPHRRLLRDESGEAKAIELAGYFDAVDGEVERWLFTAAPTAVRAQFPQFQIPRFFRTLSQWLNAIVDVGFSIERVEEPTADEETADRFPAVADTRICAYFLHFRCRKW